MNRILLVVAVAALIFAPLVTAEAAVFDMLLNIGPPEAQDEAGAVNFDDGYANNTGNTNLATTALTTLDGIPFELTIDKVNASGTSVGGIDWRDRGDAGTDALVRMAEGFVKNNSGIVRVGLGVLPAGYYTVTSYHIDPDNSQSEAISISVSDGMLAGYQDTGAVGTAYLSSIPHVAGLTTSLVEDHGTTFSFVSNGRDAVTILFDGSLASDKEVPLNGMQVTQTTVLTDYARIDFGLSGQRVESGFDGVSTTALTTLTSVTGDSYTVALSSTSSLDWRDRGDSTSTESLVQLAEDLVKNNAGDITLTLGDLPLGEYMVTSFHRDPGFSQCADIEVYVTDANGTDVLQSLLGDASANIAVNSLTTDNINSSAAVFFIESDGINDVIIRFNGTGSDTETPLNGLIIQQVVPEPGTIVMLLGLLPLAAMVLRRRRRRA